MKTKVEHYSEVHMLQWCDDALFLYPYFDYRDPETAKRFEQKKKNKSHNVVQLRRAR